MDKKITIKELEEMIATRLSHLYGITPKEANDEQFYEVLSVIARELARDIRRKFDADGNKKGEKRIYYMSMEFLMGRSLKNTLYNLSLTETAKKALKSFDISLDKLVGREETYYDSIKALIGRMAENGVKGCDGDISPIINRYMNYMQSMGMPAKTILDGLLAMCRES